MKRYCLKVKVVIAMGDYHVCGSVSPYPCDDGILLQCKDCAALDAAAAPVPPAGGEVEVLGWLFDSGPVQTITDRWDVAKHVPYSATELVDRAHVTRLQAENAALQQRLNVADQQVDDLESDIAKARESNGKLQSLARRTLWLAYVWNDHNFGPAHQEARTEAKKNGIESFEQANEFLESCLAQQSAPAAKGGNDE
jgi:type II secretory pathway component PulL